VSAPIRILSGPSVSGPSVPAGDVAPGVSDTWCCSSQFVGWGRSAPSGAWRGDRRTE
jgi:hypothetical protein